MTFVNGFFKISAILQSAARGQYFSTTGKQTLKLMLMISLTVGASSKA